MGDLTKDFSAWEFECHCGCGQRHISPLLVAGAQSLRDRIDGPVTVTSGYRCPRHPVEAGKEPSEKASFHVLGFAFDWYAPGLSLVEMLYHALHVPAFYNGGIGLYPEAKFLHCDLGDGDLRRWARVNGVYVSMEQGLREIGK